MNNTEWFLVGWFSMFGLGWLSARFYYRHKYYPLLGYMDAVKKESSMFELPETTDEETGDET